MDQPTPDSPPAPRPPVARHADQSLDDLAGLFLTDATPAPPPGGDPFDATFADLLGGPAPVRLPRPDAGAHEAPDTALLERLTAAAGPADAALTPGPAGPPADGSPLLRWTGHDEVDLHDPPRDPGPLVGRVEAVMLGNVPGLAGPWLTQYAQLLAQNDGGQHAVAILHLSHDTLDLELVEPHRRGRDDTQAPDERAPAPALRVPPGGFTDRDPVDLLDQLCRSGPHPVRTMLVHLDPRLDAAAATFLHDLTDWTLLSGTDDAAVVAAYRSVKSLLGASDADPPAGRPRLNLMVVGGDEADGRRAADKLRQAASSFLDTPLHLLGFQKQMIPARCRPLGTWDRAGQRWAGFTEFFARLRPASPAAAAPAAARTAAAKASPATAHAHLRALPPLPQPVRVDPAPPGANPRPAAAKPGPKTEPAGPATAAVSPAPDLFTLLDTDPRVTAAIPGGVALEARCPAAPDAQLALDAAGRLHLLLRHDSETGDPPTPKEAIVELVAVRTWARQHRELLQLTERTRRFDPDADPVLHLFTDRADLSVELVARLGSLLKLHLLRDVAVGHEHTWLCVPLSA